MSEEIQLPPLPEGLVWEDRERYWAVTDRKFTTEAMVNGANEVLIWTWKNQGGWIKYFGAKTQQEALNHAAALLFLGEGDE